jgi:hypothetical protein
MATTISIADFKVDLQQLGDATDAVTQQSYVIGGQVDTINNLLAAIPPYWNTPSEVPFGQLAQSCGTQMKNLLILLDEMISRMLSAYENYKDAETANVANLSS